MNNKLYDNYLLLDELTNTYHRIMIASTNERACDQVVNIPDLYLSIPETQEILKSIHKGDPSIQLCTECFTTKERIKLMVLKVWC